MAVSEKGRSIVKWKTWNTDHWVMESDEGEVLDEIVRSLDALFVLKSNGKKYTTLKAAQDAGKKNQLTKNP